MIFQLEQLYAFEPGDEREVKLVPLAGSCQVYGFTRINGSLEEQA